MPIFLCEQPILDYVMFRFLVVLGVDHIEDIIPGSQRNLLKNCEIISYKFVS